MGNMTRAQALEMFSAVKQYIGDYRELHGQMKSLGL